MEMLQSLGINQTVFFQFGIFAITFFILTFGLFTPYVHALEERQERTKGGEAASEELVQKTSVLRQEFETKARTISTQIKTIYDEHRAHAQREYDRIVSEARQQANSLLDLARGNIAAQVKDAELKLKGEIPAVANVITSKLLSKKVNS